MIALHFLYGILVFPRRSSGIRAPLDPLDPLDPNNSPRGPEYLFSFSLLLFLFAYIFASNANLDYVQWFIQSGGNLSLALDTKTERLIAAGRFAPFLLLNAAVYLSDRRPRAGKGDFPVRWALPLALLSSVLTALAFPSFASLRGFGFLAWICLVPLLSVLYRSRRWSQGVFYGTLYGTVSSVLINYWLGTFSLVSLQLIILIQLLWYLAFMGPFVFLLRSTRFRFIAVPCGWTFFELARSTGFLGYPWGLLGASQYGFVPVIQIASITGVWGVSFLVAAVNAAAAELLDRRRFSPTAICLKPVPGRPGVLRDRASAVAVIFAGGLFAASLVYGGLVLFLNPPEKTDGADEAVIALIQQNSDPRKHDYYETYDALKRLTDEAMKYKPDLVVWSETAFVPNIRRWSGEDPAVYELARLVGDFIAYQKALSTWLVTGNDDYRVVPGEGIEETRLNYNAAVFFSDRGERIETYHKNKLVPFTEYFPYEDILPGVYKTLLAYDVHFWEPGTEKTVFRHPLFSFSTPICFEDVFPGLVRRYVLAGADIIINLSNDYWSLKEAEAVQHGTHGVFRAVENRRPLLRATASGATLRADEFGRILETVPLYKEGYLIAPVPLVERPLTLYTRWGDWFPAVCGAVIGPLLLVSLFYRKNGAHPESGEHRKADPRP
jgi:apolipoprotein N-acyltransferase